MIRDETVERILSMGWIVVVFASILWIDLVVNLLGVCLEVVERIDASCIVNCILFHECRVAFHTNSHVVHRVG